MISHQELSGPQVCSYLLDLEDHFTSHSFNNLYWTSFEKYIKAENPSPECCAMHVQEGSTNEESIFQANRDCIDDVSLSVLNPEDNEVKLGIIVMKRLVCL
jgi:hypothetical protein